MSISCSHCGYVVENAPQNRKLLETIQDWIGYTLRTKQSQGLTASYVAKANIPCPTCGRFDGWVNHAADAQQTQH